MQRPWAFALAYGAAIGLAAIPGAIWLRGGLTPELGEVIAFFAAGAVAAGFVAALIVGVLPRRLRPSARYASAIVALMVLTTGAHIGLLFAEYMPYYAQWWPAPFHSWWFDAAASTFAGIGFYYGAIGLPMLLPLGLPALLAFAALLARR